MKDIEVFEGKSLSDLLKDIHDNTLQKRASIESMISTLSQYVQSVGDATIIAPIIREFFDVGVKSDEQLVKIATIVQRVVASDNREGDGDSGLLTEAEKEALLLSAMKELEITEQETTQQLQDTQDKVKLLP